VEAADTNQRDPGGRAVKMGITGSSAQLSFFPDAARWFSRRWRSFALIGIVYAGMWRWLNGFQKDGAIFQRQPHGICTARVGRMTSSGFSGALLQMFKPRHYYRRFVLLVGVLYDARTRGHECVRRH